VLYRVRYAGGGGKGKERKRGGRSAGRTLGCVEGGVLIRDDEEPEEVTKLPTELRWREVSLVDEHSHGSPLEKTRAGIPESD